MADYKQWILPRILTAQGELEIRINQGLLGFDGSQADPPLTATDIITLNQTSQIVIGIGELKKALTDEEGKLKVDSISLDLRDRSSYSGVSNGSPVSEDLGISGSSLLSKIFSIEENPVTGKPFVYEAWFTHYTDSHTETFFVGDFDALSIPYEHIGLHAVHTSTEEQKQTAQITLSLATGRLNDKTANDLDGQITSSDCTQAKFYGGSVIRPGDSGPNVMFALYDDTGLSTGGHAFPYGTWGISIQKLADKIATVAKANAFTIDDIAFRYYHQKWNGTNYELQTTDPKTYSDLYVSYNHLFGKSVVSWSGHDNYIEYPCTLGKDQPIAELVRWLCYQFGCYFTYDITYASGNATLTFKLYNRRASGLTLPTNLKLSKSKEEAQFVSKTTVTVNNKGDDEKIVAGTPSGGTITIEVPWRTHPWGEMAGDYSGDTAYLGAVGGLRFNSKWEWEDQYKAFRIEERDDNGNITDKPSADGWIGGSLLYTYQSSSPSFYHPDERSEGGGTAGGGFYALAMALPDGWSFPTSARGEGYFNTTRSAAQWYWQELVGNRAVVTRNYTGYTDDSGYIQGLKLGMQTTFRLRGTVRTFRAIEISQNIIDGSCQIKWQEVPADYDTIAKPTVKVQGDSGATSSGASSNSSSASGTATLGNYVSRRPTTSDQGKIYNQGSGVVPFSIQKISGQTSDNFQLIASDGSTLVSRFDVNGKFHTPATTSGDSSDTLTTLGFVTNTFVHRSPDDALKAKIKSSVSSGTVDTVTIEANGTNSGRLIVFNNNSGVTKTWVDAGGSLYTNASFSANGGIVTTTIAASGKITSDNTTSGDPSNTTTTKGYVDGLFASITGYVVLSPSNNTTNIVKPTGSGISNIRLQGATAGTANILLQFENNSSSAITGGMDSFGRAYFGEIPSTREIQTYVVAKDDLHTGLYVRGGTGSNSSPASLVQIDMKAAVSGRQWAFLVQPNGEMQAGWGASFGVAFKSANFTLDHTAVLWVVNAGSGAINATLPSASTCPGRVYVIERSNGAGGAVNVVRATGETIGRVAANKALGAAGASITLQSDGLTNWAII